MTPIRNLVRWYRKEFRTRAAAVRKGTGLIEWVDSGTRVSWSEVFAKARELGINTDPATLRVDFENAKRKEVP